MLAKALDMPDPLASNFCTALERVGLMQRVGTQHTANGKGKGTRVFVFTECGDFADFMQKVDDVAQIRKDLEGPNSKIVLFSDEEPEEEAEEPDPESDTTVGADEER